MPLPRNNKKQVKGILVKEPFTSMMLVEHI